MRNPLLSIIVPIFRAEKYLPKCLSSILTAKEDASLYEIILIDDGSDDKCPKICDKFANTHKNIHVIHQTNKGIAITRNRGLKEANGIYLAFVDADDTTDINKIIYIAKELQTQEVDVACFGYNVYSDDGHLLYKEMAKGITHTSLTGIDFLYQQKDFKGFIWRYLFRTQYVKEFSFREDLRWSEDLEWLQRVLINTKCVKLYNQYIYDYYLRTNSLTHSYKSNAQVLIDNKFRLINYYLSSIAPETKEWYNYAIISVIESILTVTGKYNFINKNHIIDQINDIYSRPYKIKYCSLISAIKIWIINLSPSLYCTIRHYI